MNPSLCSFLIIAALLTGPSVLFAATDTPKRIPFDGRNWIVGSHDANEQQSITEYVPEGETVDNWTELVTISEFFGLQDQITPTQLMTSMMQMAEENCSGVKKNILQTEGTESILFEWETKGCKAEIPGGSAPEFDISRIIVGKDRIFIMQHASKKALTAEKRDQWIMIISSSVFDGTANGKKSFKNVPAANQKGTP
ncbi:MAG: hypothetical protein IT395_04790 [Candidatus Omnitrophica bacterium]|nr:hypothetical protein [Candidatus Omnitrophota bacterium]